MNGKKAKRCMAAAMAVAVTFTSVDMTGLAAAGTYDADKWSGTAADIVADHYYGSNDAAKRVLSSAAVDQGTTYSGVALPTQGSELLAADTQNHVIYAKNYKSGSEVWKPVSASLVGNDGSVLEDGISFSAKDAKYDGSSYDAAADFKCDEASYTVKVLYELDVEISAEEQGRILSIPVVLAEGVENLDKLMAMNSSLGDVQAYLPKLEENIDYISDDEATSLIEDLYKEYDENGSKLKLQTMIDECTDADGSVTYMLQHGAEIAKQAKTTYGMLSDLLGNDYMQSLPEKVESKNPALANNVEALNNALEDLAGEDGTLTDLKDSSWSVFDEDGKVKAGLFTDESALADVDADVKALADSGISAPEVTETILPAAEAEVSINVASSTVKVVVKAAVASEDAKDLADLPKEADQTALKELSAAETTLTFAKGTEKADVEKAIEESGAAKDAVATWGIDEEQYEAAVTVDTKDGELPAQIGEKEDITYTITYLPKTYTVETVVDEAKDSKTVYYGTNVQLTAAIGSKSYDYIVTTGEGEEQTSAPYEQGDVLTIKEDTTITRSEGPAKKTRRVLDLLAADKTYSFSADEQAILMNQAITSPNMKLRYPTENQVVVNENDGVSSVTPVPYTSVTGSDLTWKPESVAVKNGDKVVAVSTSTDEEGNTVYSWNGSYTRVEVTYSLNVSEKVSDADLQKYVDLPYVISAAVKDQNAALADAKDIYSKLQSVEQFMTPNILRTVKGSLQSDAAKAAVDNLLERENKGGAWNYSSNEPAMYTYLKNVAAADWSVSAYYKSGSGASMNEQAARLSADLDAIINDAGFQDALDLGESMGVDKLSTKAQTIREISETLKNLVDRFKTIDQIADVEIDASSSSFGALVAAALNADAAQKTAAGLTVYGTALREAPGHGTVVVTVQVGAGAAQTEEYRYTYSAEASGLKVTDAVLSEIDAVAAQLKENAGLAADKEQFYVKKVEEGIEAGTEISGTQYVTIQYVPKTYVVTADGVTLDSFTYGDVMGAALPAYSDDEETDTYYRYTVADKTIDVPNGTKGYVSFTEDQLASFTESENGTYVYNVSRVQVEKKWEDLKNFVDTLNGELLKQDGLKDDNGNLRIAFVPVKKNGSSAYDSIVLRLVPDKDLANRDDAKSLVTAAVTALAKVSYDYIGFGSEQFKFVDENNDMKVDPQAFINMMLNSDITNDTLINTINEDGTIKDTVKVASGSSAVRDGLISATSSLGGVFVSTNLRLGSDSDNYISIPLYVTTANDNKESARAFKGLRKLAETAKEKGVVLSLTGGKVVLNGQVSDNVYKLYMAVMLMIGQADLDTFNDVELKDQVSYLKDVLEPVILDENTNWKVLQNTLNNLKNQNINMDIDLEPYSGLIDRGINKLRSYLRDGGSNLTIEQNGQGYLYGFEISYDMKDRLSNIKGGDMVLNMLANTKVSVPVDIKFFNMKETYQALVVDMGQSGKLAKVSYTTDLKDALANAKGETLAVLLSDVDTDDLTINQRTVLNLNGKTVKGNINAQSALRIVDGSAIGSTPAGKVEGSLSGNIRVAAGTYTMGLDSSMLQNGFVQDENGTVTSTYYTLTEDADGNITVILNSNFANIADNNLQTMGLDVASDILFNFYNSAMLSVDGHELYNVQLRDMLNNYSSLKDVAKALVKSVNKDGVKWAANEVIDKLTDNEAIAKALTDGTALASYSYTVAPWAATAELIGEGDDAYIGVGIVSGAQKSGTITVKFDKAAPELAEMYEGLRDIVTVKKNALQLNSLDYVDGKVVWDADADFDVTVDLESKNADASGYVEVVAVLLAHNTSDEALKAEYVKAIRNYAKGYSEDALKEIAESMPIGDLVEAMKAAKDITFESMLEDLGLTELLTEAQTLETKFHTILQISYGLTNTADRLVGDKNKVQQIYTKTLGQVKDADGSYGGSITARDGALRLGLKLKLFTDEYVSSVQKVIDMIDEIETPITPENREDQIEKVIAAREAYDELSDEEKELVTNRDKLFEAEDYFNNLGLWVVSIPAQNYTGKAIKPEVRVYECMTRLIAKKDYTVSYINNTKAAVAPVPAASNVKQKAPAAVIKFKKNYTGTIYQYFTINKIDLSRYADAEYCEQVGLEIRDVYTAVGKKAVHGKPVLYLNGKKVSTSEYKLEHNDKQDGAYTTAGDYMIQIVGRGGNFTGTAEAAQHMAGILMSKVSVAKVPAQVYGQGEWQEPKLTVTYKKQPLVEGTDYTVTYKNNDKIGTATAVITGTNNYAGTAENAGWSFTGTKTVTFKITGTKLASKMVTLNVKSKTYTGEEITLSSADNEYAVAGLTEGVDYTVSYKKNVNKGTATVTFTGIGAYTGTVKKTFKITAAALTADMEVSQKQFTVTYNKKGVKPADRIRLEYNGTVLTYGKDYTISWKNNKAVAAADSAKAPQYRITGKGNFTGRLGWETFTIEAADLSQTTVTAADIAYKAKAGNFKTKVQVVDVDGGKLSAGKDYVKTVTYYVLNADGTYEEVKADRVAMAADASEILMKVAVNGTGVYTGTAEAEYRIYKNNIAKAKVTKVEKSVTYNRNEQELSNLKTTVVFGKDKRVLKEGKDYTVTYTKNIFAGTATAVIKGMPGSEFGGTKKVTFRIKPWNAWLALHRDEADTQSMDDTVELPIIWQW